ncbi:TatD family hydrolase [Candidatus Woesearchaeota archaeon]|jgi:TatD DNase family protein|nr:TatD family hydrolase [Candidatus Woesearchaeota archaeon]MBT4835442.1 TatD family hydrolase [Candidatus Woesearchaeota archaeon]MBT6734866.1 TatD family hydrolase [Candidatus Woesearchaeota archaeon]MBT7169619.1 TatD family hydrolase [Candidatus Woesearchaeota archaeon]MBT7474577.1 TatD family hydrolase [Candidatus Woesearchaeota archaeon]
MLVDVHTHLDLLEKEKDLDKVLKNSEKVKVIITNGTGPESNRRVLEISKKYEKVKPALGLYPDKAISLTDEEIEDEIRFIKSKKPVAIGEVGLDNYRIENLERQKKVLIKFIKLSKELDVPIIIHSRKAEEETLNILEKNDAKKVIMHCFSGNKELTERAVSLGYYFTIPCTITRNKTFRKLSKRIPLNRLLTETDAPYLSSRDEANEPAFIEDSIKKIAELKQLNEEELEKIIFMNYQNIFLK